VEDLEDMSGIDEIDATALLDDAIEEELESEDNKGIEVYSEEEESSEDYDDEDSDFDFSQFYQDEESTEDVSESNEVVTGIYNDEEAYDEILDLHSDISTVAVEATYPYIRISGFVIKDEIIFMQKILQEYMEEVKSKYKEEDMLDIMMNVNGDDYTVGKVPLTLDTFLTVFRAHRYNVELVRSETVSSSVTSDLMKAFLFT